jgi:hypothetical protein
MATNRTDTLSLCLTVRDKFVKFIDNCCLDRGVLIACYMDDVESFMKTHVVECPSCRDVDDATWKQMFAHYKAVSENHLPS